MPVRLTHEPVMVQEILQQVAELLTDSAEPRGYSYLDGTFGRGGHFQKIAEAFKNSRGGLERAVGLDRDEDAIEYARATFGQDSSCSFFCERFAHFDSSRFQTFDFILVDLGVSSPQLEDPQRGFSFYHPGPLDMRMGKTQEYSAADVINTFDAEELTEIFKKYGEIYQPFRLVEAIVDRRRQKLFQTTDDLASFMEKIWGWRKKGEHPATHIFRALRLFVNQELEEVERGIPKLITGLRPKGRLAVLTFHSLEDRMVKEIFKSSAHLGAVVNKKVIKPTREEILRNPRSRSAFLRVFSRDQEAGS